MGKKLLWLPCGKNNTFIDDYDAVNSTNSETAANEWLEKDAGLTNGEVMATANNNYNNGVNKGVEVTVGVLAGLLIATVGIPLVIGLSQKLIETIKAKKKHKKEGQ